MSEKPRPKKGPTPPEGGVTPTLVPHLWKLRNQLREGRDPEKVLKAALRLGLDLFHAGSGCVAWVRATGGPARVLFAVPESDWWDGDLIAGFLRGEKVRVPPDLMLARIRRHGRMWGALALRSSGPDYHWDDRQGLSSIAALANELIDQIDQERVREVRARVDRKVLEQSQPKHLFYEVLHGLRSLTAYDHSAALLTYDPEPNALEVVAEQVAWQKAKGRNVGRKVSLCATTRAFLAKGQVFGFDRQGRGWSDWTGSDATALAEVLDFDGARSAHAPGPPAGAILCAPLATRSGLLGVLKVAAMEGGAFGRYEADLLAQFLPQAAVALGNARRAESLEKKVLTAERKHAMADLARGVSHDMNNALGGVLPLVQQLRADLEEGEFDPALAAEDLRAIEQSIQVCRRIFGNMLGFARGLGRHPSAVSLHQAAEASLAFLGPSLDRRGTRLVLDLPEDLPSLWGTQADVQQLLLNLIGNARDATSSGDTVTIRARAANRHVELEVEDTGRGMTRDQLAKTSEPFFTTKEDGHGLGLAICRSIVAQMKGRLDIESAFQAGTRVRVVFPIDQEVVS